MNRRERRAAGARGKTGAGAAPADIADAMAQAKQAYQQGQTARAEVLCEQIIARAPAHALGLNLLGVIYQTSGRHRLAVKMFAKALAADGLDAAFHYNIANSYQALDQRANAAAHFKQAIAFGLNTRNVEDFLIKNPVVIDCLSRMTNTFAPAGNSRPLFDAGNIGALADDVLFRCALEAAIVRGLPLELFLTHLRLALLGIASAEVRDPIKAGDKVVELFCALARQCFINEYVFAQSEEETRQADRLRALLLERLSSGNDISPLLLAAVAAYFPLHEMPAASALLTRRWPDCVADLLRQQISEPLEEAQERLAIPALTAVDDGTSIQVMRQYEEHPYPRWTVNRLAVVAAGMKRHAGAATPGASLPREEILIAGCGTGQHAFDVAQQSPDARILAIDISRPSLAYARRKTREAGLQNIEYAQADILKLGTIERRFDRIENIGVLHHLADPEAGWRALLSLLKPDGTMHIGLYSQAARRSVVDARALVAARGYRAAADDIRALRQTIIRSGEAQRWDMLFTTVDFFSLSGCRDLLFNVMEHRFTIPRIAAFLDEHGLAFLGFKLDDETVERFQRQYPGDEALTSLERWNAFEAVNPDTFRQMYVFSVRRITGRDPFATDHAPALSAPLRRV